MSRSARDRGGNRFGGLFGGGLHVVRPETPAPVAAVGSFQALIASPAHGAFEMPADAQIAILARGGDCLGCPLVTLTKPGWNPRVIAAPGMNPGQRSVIAGVVRRGTLVEAGPGGLEVQILHDEQWKTIARG
jgi:hypothetical protein